jgi:hypothetical protein
MGGTASVASIAGASSAPTGMPDGSSISMIANRSRCCVRDALFRPIAVTGCAGPRGSLNDEPASILLGEANVKGAAQTKSAHWGTAAEA